MKQATDIPLIPTHVDLMFCYLHMEHNTRALVAIKAAENMVVGKHLKRFVVSRFHNAKVELSKVYAQLAVLEKDVLPQKLGSRNWGQVLKYKKLGSGLEI